MHFGITLKSDLEVDRMIALVKEAEDPARVRMDLRFPRALERCYPMMALFAAATSG